MRAIVCVDSNNGTMFNHRRQSKDQVLRDHILAMVGGPDGAKLRVSSYTARQFTADQQGALQISDDYLTMARTGEYAFVEDGQLSTVESSLEAIILYRWDRIYPADTFLDIPLPGNGWTLTETLEFAGNSHEKIIKEVYTKWEKSCLA